MTVLEYNSMYAALVDRGYSIEQIENVIGIENMRFQLKLDAWLESEDNHSNAKEGDHE